MARVHRFGIRGTRTVRAKVDDDIEIHASQGEFLQFRFKVEATPTMSFLGQIGVLWTEDACSFRDGALWMAWPRPQPPLPPDGLYTLGVSFRRARSYLIFIERISPRRPPLVVCDVTVQSGSSADLSDEPLSLLFR
jgi:hypothetical protein